MEFHYSGNEDKYYEISQQEEKSDYSQGIGGQIHISLQQSTLDASRQWNNAFKFLKESKPRILYPAVLIRVLLTVRNRKPISNGLNKQEMYYLALYEIQRQGITKAGKFISLIMISDKNFPDSSPILRVILNFLDLYSGWFFSSSKMSTVLPGTTPRNNSLQRKTRMSLIQKL